MKIFHYTNINALALILKNQTIRFNRLDNVDDLEEGYSESLGVQYCKYVFVSCWTENEQENIPLWKMYGNGSEGIRISLNKEMFKFRSISDLDFGGEEAKGYINSLVHPSELKHVEYSIFPPFFMGYSDFFYRKIKYVDDIFKYTKDAIKIERDSFKMETIHFGSYKNPRWQFQEETRFVLNFIPHNIMLNGHNQQIGNQICESLLTNKQLPFTYYDLSLNEDAFKNIEITLNPVATEAERIIVKALVDKYVPTAKIYSSSLGKLVKFK